MKSLKAQVSVALVCIVLGLMLAYQFKAVRNSTNLARTQRVEELSSQLKVAQKQKEDLEINISDLEKKIEDYEKNVTTTGGMANSLKNELDNTRMLSGQTKIEGPGVIITVTPPHQNLDTQGLVPVSFVYLLLIVNELNASGSEAIMINDQRIVSTTQIREGGSTIVINDVRYSSLDKFEIKAIGDPVTLETGINMAGGVKQELEWNGISVKTQKADNIIIFKYNKVVNFKYAKPIKEGE